uniref:NADH-ubiquinone oxidoreductase chain 4 n=1 Tax=Lysippe labiata TaxID=1818077 RepID=A0A220T2V5_9ANNE|nr:NADH dehydrogenase subunit 4 [Lysippe labiata]
MLKIILSMMFLPTILWFSLPWVWMTSYCFCMSFVILQMFYVPNCCLSNISGFNLDTLSSSLYILTLWISGLMSLASYKILLDKNNSNGFLFVLMLLMIVLSFCFFVSNALVFYILFEASLVPTLYIILYWGGQPERLKASISFMIYTLFASLPLLISLLMIYNKNSHLNMSVGWWALPVDISMGVVWWIFATLAFMVKLPIYSVHLWLPKAHVEAPAAGSMILAAVLLKLGAYGLIRFSSLLPMYSVNAVMLISANVMIGACVCSMICLRQSDIKAMIAYSSISHMSMVIVGVLMVSVIGVSGAMCMLIGHGLISSMMFAIANTSYELTHSRSLMLNKGYLSLFPSMSLWWFLVVGANMSAPPSLNLVSEVLLLGVIAKLSFFLLAFFMVSCFLVGAFCLFLYSTTQHGGLMSYILPLSPFFLRNHVMMFLHFMPILFIPIFPYIVFWT